MSLQEKSVENFEVAVKCCSLSFNNACAARAYYSSFQMLKHFLQSEGFDYKSYLNSTGRKDEREYSHGTIKYAFISFCLSKNIAKEKYQIITTIDDLYMKRKRADYDGVHIDSRAAKTCVYSAKNINTMIQELK